MKFQRLAAIVLGAGFFLPIAVLPTTGSAETLRDALALAYDANPTIRAERARLRAVRESKSQAWAGALPQVQGAGSYQKVESDQLRNFGTGQALDVSNLDTLTASVNGELPVFTGFRNYNTIQQAAARVRAGGAQLVGVEQGILSEVATAYFNVVRNVSVFELNSKNVAVLARQLEMASARFEVGEITRTDVAQAEARLANSRAQLTNAQGNLAIARSAFARLVGHIPGDLEDVTTMPPLPETEAASQAIAFQFAPNLVLSLIHI